MKKLAVFSVIMLFAVTSVSAQIFSLGIKTGYNVTLERNQQGFTANNQLFDIKGNLQNGFNVGVYARIGRSLYVQPEVDYKYFTYTNVVSNGGGEMNGKKYVVSTMDIPILLGYSLINSNFFKLRVMAGPRFSFNAGSTKASSWLSSPSRYAIRVWDLIVA